MQASEQEVMVRQVTLALPADVIGLGSRDFVFHGIDSRGVELVLPLADHIGNVEARVQRRVFGVA